MVLSENDRGNTGLQGAASVRSDTLHRLGAWLCLLAVLAQLGLPVVHLWDVPLEVTSAVFRFVARGTKGSTAFRSSPAPARHVPHDASMCALCQAFAHTRDNLIRHSAEPCFAVSGVALFPDTTGGGTAPDLHAAVPRAPPCSFS